MLRPKSTMCDTFIKWLADYCMSQAHMKLIEFFFFQGEKKNPDRAYVK